MSNRNDELIAGSNRVSDWQILRPSLLERDPRAWSKAYKDYFLARLKSRYLDPISLIRDNGSHTGEGFSIVAIQCSLIEFLETIRDGWWFDINIRSEEPCSERHLYGTRHARPFFLKFLTPREPFCRTFTEDLAKIFYSDIRCPILREARTGGGWRIWANDNQNRIADINKKILYRDNFQVALRQYIDCFNTELQGDTTLQDGFIRKFDKLFGI